MEIPALRSAKKVSGYLLFDAGQYMEDDEGDLSEEVGGQIDAAWYGDVYKRQGWGRIRVYTCHRMQAVIQLYQGQ